MGERNLERKLRAILNPDVCHINPLSSRRSENGTNIINHNNLVLAVFATTFGHFPLSEVLIIRSFGSESFYF